MSVELFRITDADVLRAKDVWESQCGMVELIGPQNGDVSLPQCIAADEGSIGGSSNLHAAIPSSRQAGPRYAVYFLFLC